MSKTIAYIRASTIAQNVKNQRHYLYRQAKSAFW